MNSPGHNSDWIDASLYPDTTPPATLDSFADRVDFVARVCAAWDFGIMPRAETLRELLRDDWRNAVDETNLLTSCAYHLLREWHGLPLLRYLGPRFPEIERDSCLDQV
jgi:hypothetical protein